MTTQSGIKSDKDWMREVLHDGYGQSLEVETVLYDSNTEHQRLKLFENKKFGRVLTLDNVVQTTQNDEFVYHEMLTHVPLFAHGNAKNVLIIGGGDGGIAREVLKHPVETVTMIEIDAGVVEFSKKYLPTLSDGAFEDERLTVIIDDGARYMRENQNNYDVIIVDSTDPIGPGEVLFTDTFYGHAQRALGEKGILVTQNGVPFMQPDELSQTLRAFKALFKHYGCYLAHVPSYAGGAMALGFASQTDYRGKQKECDLNLKYYNSDVHVSAFSLPNYIRKLFP
jgi:spermidine synthase